ncbi:2-(1,2-epoxy-1,2-dihydrophenyl)acetyl-CoA isomerase [Haloechinothrix alba]|uniref:2-(1,2-epoxy-1,2-dihydrophenyl)acetyl-CoA isomerase n=1 Tax=Haloechinothrix alba TaxID=664784 RepID=A0A239AFG8_9PSEU|nr:2-(1,2-epoxy-1,2-dihydrophenyl)acetyl-CoA isomerase [Haloechinothrix alba]
MSYPSELVIDRADDVVTLTLNRPERRNGVTWPLIEELIQALETVASNVEDRAVVLTGAGGAFCSGMDLAKSVAPNEFEFMRRVGHAVTLLHELPKPTIAKVSGAAVGFGCNLALACDLVVAGETALFGEVFADRGLSLDGAGSWSLPRLIGLAKAKEIVFFGSKLSGAEANDIGLVNQVVAEDKLDTVVADWATRLADGPTLALSMMKKALNTSLETPFATAVEQESLAQSLSFRSQEAREGMTAFLERRPPRFRG